VDSVNSLTQLRKETLWQQIGWMVDARRMGSGGHGADVRASETTLTDGTWRALGLGLLRAAQSLACGSIFGSFLPVRRDGICAALLSRWCHRSFGSINFGDAADHLCGSELQHLRVGEGMIRASRQHPSNGVWQRHRIGYWAKTVLGNSIAEFSS
jgi:hypothetical protein